MKYFILILVFCCSQKLIAQVATKKDSIATTSKVPAKPPMQAIGKLIGRVVFTKNSKVEPLAYASVTVCKIKDSSIVAGAVADNKGFFEVTKIPLGAMYYLQVQAIGFQKKRFGKYQVTMREPEMEVGDLNISETISTLKEVLVTTKKEDVEYRLDRKVYNVKQTLNTQGGTAVDALQNIPSVTVDADGSVQLRGSEKILVLIDGKPSSITGNDRQAVLNQIPASIIDKIEVITSPSVKYDSESSAGIINIITKKDKRIGFNGSATYTVGNRDKYNGSFNLNYRKDKSGFLFNYDQIHDRRFSERNAQREITGTGINSFVTENEYADGFSNSHNIKLGVDYFITKRQTISATTFLKFGNVNAQSDNPAVLYNASRVPIVSYNTGSDRKDKENTQDFTVGYRKTFAQTGKEWTIDMVYLQGFNESNQGVNRQNFNTGFTLPTGLSQLWQNNSQTNFYTFTAQTDFVKPIKKIGKLEFGLKLTARNNDANFQFRDYVYSLNRFKSNPNFSNRFVFDENVFAGYINVSNQYKKLNYSFGLRPELTQQKGTQKSPTSPSVNDSSYFSLFPSALLNYQIKEKQRLQFGFTRRINRPAYGVLNPFITAPNPQNLFRGNPYVRSELVNSFELGHLAITKKGSVNTTLYYRYTSGQVGRIRTIVDSLRSENTTIITPDNIQNRTVYGLEFVLLQNITKAWRINGNFNVYHSKLLGNAQNTQIDVAFNAFTTRVTNAFRFGKDWEVQLIGTYRSLQQNTQGETKPVYFMDFGLKKEVFKSKATFNFRVSDVFNTFQFDVDVRGKDFYMLNPLKRETRVAFIGLTYRFAQKTKAAERRERKAINETRAGEGEN